MSRRDERKKQRRKNRLEKKHKRNEARAALGSVLDALSQYAEVGDPQSFPGSCDETLARPDLVKLDFMDFALNRHPGKQKFEQLEGGLRRGLLHYLPDIDHWAMEEFAWHGEPGDSWHPIDEFLRSPGLPLSSAARQQISLWKRARIGMFEIGNFAGVTIGLREWDVIRQRPIGDPFRAISLNMGGAQVYAAQKGRLLLTYVSPWDPDRNIRCALGYGVTVPKNESLFLHEFLELRHLDVVSRPLPWMMGRESERRWLREWRNREWHGWFSERLQFPFEAFVPTPPKGLPELLTVHGITPSTRKEAEQMGVYFHGDNDSGLAMVMGGTGVTPIDVTSTNRLAFAEYHAYRAIVGPPVGTKGKPSFVEFGPGW